MRETEFAVPGRCLFFLLFFHVKSDVFLTDRNGCGEEAENRVCRVNQRLDLCASGSRNPLPASHCPSNAPWCSWKSDERQQTCVPDLGWADIVCVFVYE